MTLIESVKKALRVSHDALDEAEIQPLIDAALRELNIAGVVMLAETDPMIVRYVTAYVKAHFGYDNPEAERFERIADSIKSVLSQVAYYNTVSGELPVSVKTGGGDG